LGTRQPAPEDIDRLFGAPLTTAADSGAWLPPVDIHEEANQFALHVDLPVWIRKRGNHRGSRCAHHSRTTRGHAQGIPRGLPPRRAHQRANSSAVSACRIRRRPEHQAKFVNGVLEVAIPKLAQVQPRRITVEAA